MKKNKFLLILAFLGAMLACDDEGGQGSTGVDFETLSTFSDEDGGTITIPIRGGVAKAGNVRFSGTAVEGVDFEFAGVSDEGVQIEILDDDSLESIETIKVILNSPGNNVHTLSVGCDGGDVLGFNIASYAGTWHATEDYGAGGTFGPYNVTFAQDAGNPNMFLVTGFYGFATRKAYLVFDLANGIVSFPAQTPTNPGANGSIAGGSTGTFDLCENTLTIDLNYDGGDWVYRFQK
jgi:hypothetical protein